MIDLSTLKPGIAIDIDDTIADTRYYVAQKLTDLFGAGEGLTPKQIIEKYRHIIHIPFWQTPEIVSWLNNRALSNQEQEDIWPVKDAAETLHRIGTAVPISCYITARPTAVSTGSVNWTKKNNFPDAPVITLDEEYQGIDGCEWKAIMLKKMFPVVTGIIDDNKSLAKYLGPDYQGTMFLLSNEPDDGIVEYTVQCHTWAELEKEVMARQSTLNKKN